MSRWDDRMARSAVWLRRHVRLLRFAVLAAALTGAGYLWNRFDTVRLGAADSSAQPFYPAGSTLLLDTWDRLGTHGSHHVGFRFRGEDGFRIGRVIAGTGQKVDLVEGEAGLVLTVDGVSTGILLRGFDDPERCSVELGPDQAFVVSLVPSSSVPDSRTLGPLRAAQLAGRVLVKMPW